MTLSLQYRNRPSRDECHHLENVSMWLQNLDSYMGPTFNTKKSSAYLGRGETVFNSHFTPSKTRGPPWNGLTRDSTFKLLCTSNMLVCATSFVRFPTISSKIPPSSRKSRALHNGATITHCFVEVKVHSHTPSTFMYTVYVDHILRMQRLTCLI